MFIDIHCHISKEDYEDIPLLIKEVKEARVSHLIISGCTKASFKEAIELSKTFENIYVTLGFHPSEVQTTKEDLKQLEDYLSLQKVVGIGEIGLDYHYGKEDKDKQISLFDYQLDLAEKYHLPVVIHSRDATKDTIEILKRHKVTGIIHCFSGSLEVAKEYISMNFYLGIGGVLTFKNSKLKDVIEKIPLERLVLETDSPYLTPEPFRGKQNSSKYIPIIAKKLSEIKEVDIDKVAQLTSYNAKEIFHINF